MVDLIYGRGITDLIREMPFYINIFTKYAFIKLFHAKPTMYGSVDIINVCNLHCTHCYWWLNRKDDNNDLSAQQWREIIGSIFKKQHIFVVTLVGGELFVLILSKYSVKKCQRGFVLLPRTSSKIIPSPLELGGGF
jgi:MoaA/NifB/PqqE/SkfB family radical SAM enzyme